MRAASEALVGVPLVVVSVGIDSWLRRLMRAGAMGFVHEDQVERALAPTVSAVVAGQTAIPLSLAHHVRESALSHRERQILELVALGFTNTEIARRCFLAESTIKTHLSAGFRKLGVHSRKDAAALILDPDGGFATGILGLAAGDAEREEPRHR
jgi:DNA-binding NarL/FixJ family response regulator